MAKTEKIDYVSDYYTGRGSYRGPYAEYEHLILSSLSPGKTILDVGCGRTFPMASKWLDPGASVYGVDPIIDADAMLPGVTALKGGAEKIDCPDNSFDLIVSCAVLEHLENPLDVFKEFYRLLKPGGKAVLLTPSKYDYVSIVARLVPNKFHGWLVNATEGRDESDTFPTFYRANSYKQISSLADSVGFFKGKMKYLDQSPYSLKFNTFLYKLACYYHKFLRSFDFLQFLNGWILCEIIKPESGR